MKLSNFSKRQTGGRMVEEDIVLTKRCRIEPANNCNIQFEYEESPEGQGDERVFTVIGTIFSPAENEVISINGCVTIQRCCFCICGNAT